jgi:hypothetical protein
MSRPWAFRSCAASSNAHGTDFCATAGPPKKRNSGSTPHPYPVGFPVAAQVLRTGRPSRGGGEGVSCSALIPRAPFDHGGNPGADIAFDYRQMMEQAS